MTEKTHTPLKKLSKAQQEIIDLLSNGWELGISLDLGKRVRHRLQKGGIGHGGEVRRISKSAVDALQAQGLLREVFKDHRVEKFTVDAKKLAIHKERTTRKLPQCQFLKGENVKPRTKAEALDLKGKRVRYLRDIDIDKSGRGYYFPREGYVDDAVNREIVIDGSYITLSSLREMVILKDKQPETN